MNAKDRGEQRVTHTIAKMYEYEDVPASVTDIMTDLRHFCDRHGIDFHEHLDRSYDHYCAELREEDE